MITKQFKRCPKCGKTKPFSDFQKDKTKSGGRTCWCKKCQQALNRICKMRKKFNISEKQYQKMLSEQNGVCSICGFPETKKQNGKIVMLAVDHCHVTGKNRGLLCMKCNVALGAFRDDIDIMASAISYLKQCG